MKYFILGVYLLLGFLLVSCAGTRTATQTSDTYRHDAQRLDSTFTAAQLRDSIYVRDSIYIREKGDTVAKYVERTYYRYLLKRDTVYRNVYARDTVYIERRDSIAYEKPVIVKQPQKWHNNFFTWIGRAFVLALLLWALFFYLKRKY